MKKARKSRGRRLFVALGVLAATAAIATPAASAAPAPAWQLDLDTRATNLPPDSTGVGSVNLIANNVGAAPSSGPVTLTIALPSGITPDGSEPVNADQRNPDINGECTATAQMVTCTNPNVIDPGEWLQIGVFVNVDDLPDPTLLEVHGSISGGGGGTAAAGGTVTISDDPGPGGFLAGRSGLNAATINEAGLPATQAGSHPYRLNINLGFSVIRPPGNFPLPNGTLHDLAVDLPAGMVVNPAATPKCSQPQLISGQCPDSSQVGVVTIPLSIGLNPGNLYNMEPPPGVAAAFGFVIANVPVQVMGGVRPGDYRITSLTSESIATLAVMGARVQLWGSPGDASHDSVRGDCKQGGASATCPVTPRDTPLLTLPTSCTESMQIDARLDLWEELGNFQGRAEPLTDVNGNPTPVTGCSQLDFAPTLQARPTTNVADSPTGLDVSLKVPQTDTLDTLATAHLRKAVVTLPEGLLVNPASANGLTGCSPAQIGLTTAPGQTPIRFDGARPACPDAAKIGTVEVTTALLEHPLPGSVFVATPEQNPFGSLLAIYIALDDPVSGIVVKLAGHVHADPQTGRLTTTFDENPQLPFDEFKLDFFGGAGAALRTPPTCGSYSASSSMTPWSAPASGPPAAPRDTWSITQSPNGACATSEGALPNSPSFDAGSVRPIAGAETPFVLHLARNDATQTFSALTVSPPPGLVAKLAGTSPCPDSVLAAASQRAGKDEQASPSCPANSQVGSFTAATGAGPAPYHAPGKVYLSGPYKGAPLSFAFVAPAVAGPYDLGTIVTRAAVYIDRETAKVTTVSDPLPEILEGIVLDVRSVDVSLDRPDFTRNGTSCDPLAVTGTLISTLGQSVSLSSRFQLAECRRLAFKPKLRLSLKGATKRTKNPRLIANLTARPGEANIAKAQVKLPSAAFLDQSHIGTVCTRVQFAADTCPEGSIYGFASATSPIVDYTVSGPVYLRSSTNLLPDLVVKLNGPDTQPIEVNLVGRTDSVKGALRNTFEAVPDVPVSSFHLELFGGKRGLVELSRNLCRGTYRASVHMEAHNGDTFDATPRVGNSCKRKGKKRRA